MNWFAGTVITGTSTEATEFEPIPDSNLDDMYLNTDTGNIYKQVLPNYWIFLYNGNINGINSNPINIRLLSEDDFNAEAVHDNRTLSITNNNGDFSDISEIATMFVGPMRLSDIVVLNDIPGVGTTYQLYIENNILQGFGNNIPDGLGNPNKLYVWYNNDNFNIFVYNPLRSQFMQLSNNSNSGSSSGGSVYYVADSADIGNESAYIEKTIVYYPQ